MTTRQNIPPVEPGVEQLPNGYAGSDQPSDYFIPPCGIEDVDVALFNLFDTEIGFVTTRLVNGANGPVNVSKPIVFFATGERFAIVKRLRPVRDRNGALMLPAISIRRTAINQSQTDMNNRGMNQTTGELTIKRRLDPKDRNYQNFINKSLLKNADLPTTERVTGETATDTSVRQGMLLDPKFGNNVFEIITIPQPQFYSATYEVVFWTSFTQHMSYLIETMLSSQLPQGKMFKLTTDKGYWFVGYVDDSIQSQENFDDFTEKERIVRYSFTMRVDAFLLAPNGPGNPVPFRRYLSATQVSFEVVDDSPPITNREAARVEQIGGDKFTLSDVVPDNKTGQRPTTLDTYLFKRETVDPNTGRTKTRYVHISDRNQRRAETVYYASDQETLDEFFFPVKHR